MFSGLLNKASDGPEYGYAYQERQPFQWKWWHVAIILIGIFPYVCIFALFGMVSNVKHETTTNNYYNLIGASSQLTSSGTVSVGSVVSLSSSGKIQAGAGTSIYKSIVDFEATCPSYLSMDAVYSNAYLTSYANKGSLNATLQVTLMSSTPNKANVVSTLETRYFMYEVLSLSQSSGLFVGITQDSSDTSETAYLVAGKVDGATYKISLGQGVQYAEQYSMDPQITKLSDSTFAIAYYTYEPGFLATRFGSVDATTLTVTISEEYLYQNNSQYSYYAEVVGMSPSQYMLMYFDSYVPDDVSSQSGSGPLSVVVATISGNPSQPQTASISFSNATTLTNSALTYYFAGTLLESNTSVVAYVDANNNYGITCQIVKLASDLSTPVVFGGSWMVTSGQALTDLSNWIMDIDIGVVSDAGNFMVLYSDISNNGAMTATVGQLTVSGDLLRASPDFVLNTGNTQLSSVYSWGALASGVTTPLGSQTAILTSLTDFNCDVSAVSTFSMMEMMPLPYGVVTSVTNGLADIAVSGSVSSSSLKGLTTGVNYYTNTMGGVVASTAYYGHESTGDSSTYFYVDNGNTIVTLDSKVGLATSSNTVYIQPK